jgi:hypothetical protein
MKMRFAAVHESGSGTKRTCRRGCSISVVGGRAEVIADSHDDRLGPQPDIYLHLTARLFDPSSGLHIH